MSFVEVNQVSDLFAELHPDVRNQGAAEVMASFDRWSLITYSVGMLGRCHWWFWDANPRLAQLIRGDRPSVTVEDAGRRYIALGEEISQCDGGFVRKIDEIGDLVERGRDLRPMIAVKGRNPFSAPSIIEGNHRSLAIYVAYLREKVERERGYQVMVGRKSILGF